MEGVQTRNQALNKSEMEFKERFKANEGSFKPNKRMNQIINTRPAEMKSVLANVQKQTKKTKPEKSVEAIF